MQTDGKLASKQQLSLAAKPRQLTLSTPKADQSSPQPRPDKYRGAALGMVSTESFPAIVGTADAMIKAADVFLVGYEKTGSGHCTAIVRGGIADVRMAVEAGVKTAQEFGQYVSSTLIPRPLPNLEAVLPICARWDQLRRTSGGKLGSHAIGLLETRGFPAMVGAADAMTKAADIQLMSHETIGDGLCTILIRGSLPNVAIAIEAGIHEAERIGELHAVMVIPRPLDDLEDSLPQAALEQAQPLRLPLNLAAKQTETDAEPLILTTAADEAVATPLTLSVEPELAPEVASEDQTAR
ncbi:MAG TPA: carbon dioxide-concentrating mechanism protein CcmK [Leptolyngbyaceae cyanobacterium M65_K2018_010]|nr:carbon dioxide-concentrating mechanism protein CcmK [Leptolyngbyaceae cyanobacterium M65_K2018_010]